MSITNAELVEVKPGSFVYASYAVLSKTVCQNIIDRFETHTEHQNIGRIGQKGSEHTDVKRSTDLRVSGREEWRDVDAVLLQSLSKAVAKLAQSHPFFANNSFKDIGYNLQRTKPGEFYEWHIDSGPGLFSQRQLVAIWYLNTVPGPGGETEFYFQDIIIKPERGKLILFPPFWTHLHRGKELVKGEKYIATTWVCFS